VKPSGTSKDGLTVSPSNPNDKGFSDSILLLPLRIALGWTQQQRIQIVIDKQMMMMISDRRITSTKPIGINDNVSCAEVDVGGSEGAKVGWSVGEKVECVVGSAVVVNVGGSEGEKVGWPEGDIVGANVGDSEGEKLGWPEGDIVGANVGDSEGEKAGSPEGDIVGSETLIQSA